MDNSHVTPTQAGYCRRQYPDGSNRRQYWDGSIWCRAEIKKNGQSKNPPHFIASAFQFLPWSAA